MVMHTSITSGKVSYKDSKLHLSQQS